MRRTLALALAAAAIISLVPANRARASSGDETEKRAEKVSSEIEQYLCKTGSRRVTVIVQLNGAPTPSLSSFLMRAGLLSDSTVAS